MWDWVSIILLKWGLFNDIEKDRTNRTNEISRAKLQKSLINRNIVYEQNKLNSVLKNWNVVKTKEWI